MIYSTFIAYFVPPELISVHSIIYNSNTFYNFGSISYELLTHVQNTNTT